MKRRWRQGDPDRRTHPRDAADQMVTLAQDVIELAADLRRIVDLVRVQEVERRGR